MECFLQESIESEVAQLSDKEVAKEAKRIGFDAPAVLNRVKDAVARYEDRRKRSTLREKIARVKEIATSLTDMPTVSIQEFREQLRMACQSNPAIEVQFREFTNLENPEELKRALAILSRIQEEQKKTDG